MRQDRITVIGGGLAGSEAAYQIAQRGIPVDLYEMRSVKTTPAHTTDKLAELVCSNSFGSLSDHSASRILKDEIGTLGAFVLGIAKECAVPAGASLAVDREKFAERITSVLGSHPLIRVVREEVPTLPEDGITVLATGPLTSPELSAALGNLVGDSLYFYDAISPIVSADSLDLSKMFLASRYDKGDPDFLNIPLDKEQYDTFVDALTKAEVTLAHDFEEEKYFEACMPIETIASRGHQTLAFGPMKPVGLNDPKTGKRAYAVIQLRTENKFRTSYNLVGFQTKMKYGAQEKLFRTLPGLENAEFLRLGSMHRNTYLNSPKVLDRTLQFKVRPTVFVAGQLTGTEGYLESTATGLIAGVNAARLFAGKELLKLPETTMLGALLAAITDPAREKFQPMNSNMGVLPPLEKRPKGKPERNKAFSERSEAHLKVWRENSEEFSLPKGELEAEANVRGESPEGRYTLSPESPALPN